MLRQIQIPNFKSISQKTGEKNPENKILAKGNNSCKSRSKSTKVDLDLYNVKTNSYSKFQVNITKKKLERKVRKNKIFAKGNYSSKSGSNETKVELDLYYVKTNPYTKCQVNISKDDWEKFGKPSGRKTEWTDGRTDRGRVNIVPRCHR